MEPQIQYCTTSDGVSIAYAVSGDGPPLVRVTPGVPSHLLIELEVPGARAELELLAERHTVVRYDGRGMGLSQDDARDYSLEARLRDLEAVVEHLGLPRFTLFGPLHAALATIAYAARRPERVAALAMVLPYANARRLYEISPVFQAWAAMESITKQQYEFLTLSMEHRLRGYRSPTEAARAAERFRRIVDADRMLAFRRQNREIDVRQLLGEVRAPTLVITSNQDVVPPELWREVAAGIPGARLLSIAPAPGEFPSDVAAPCWRSSTRTTRHRPRVPRPK